jgi:hypothetical protein
MQEIELDGGCLCGSLRYSVCGQWIDAGYCHCRICQRSSGAPLVAWLTVPINAFRWTFGTAAYYQSSPLGKREFCNRCGTPILFSRIDKPATVDITIASLDHPETVAPQYHIWTASRIPWLADAHQLPCHAEAGPGD